MCKWEVYEHLKKHFLRTGEILSREQLLEEFNETPREDIDEGIQEFSDTIGRGGLDVYPGGANLESGIKPVI